MLINIGSLVTDTRTNND